MSGARYWLVVPAAGIGQRMASDTPKQYLPLAGRCVLAQSLQTFAAWGKLRGACIALHPDDRHYDDIATQIPIECGRVAGGERRIDSVCSGMLALRDDAADDDWVLVHDAVRPCLSLTDLQGLVDTLADDPIGGLLAARSNDTLKRDDGHGRVERTENRDTIWCAQTPQMFRYGPLLSALTQAIENQVSYGDESAAMEAAGHRPRLIESQDINIKITRPSDLLFAKRVLDARRAA